MSNCIQKTAADWTWDSLELINIIKYLFNMCTFLNNYDVIEENYEDWGWSQWEICVINSLCIYLFIKHLFTFGVFNMKSLSYIN